MTLSNDAAWIKPGCHGWRHRAARFGRKPHGPQSHRPAERSLPAGWIYAALPLPEARARRTSWRAV